MSLAIKYRPQVFSDVVGQDAIVNVFKNVVSSGTPYPGYILAGPFGTGKTTLARLFAKALLCLNPTKDNEPCNECDSCKMFQKDRHPCFREIDAASHGLIDNIRQISEESAFAPTEGYKYRFLILDEAHMLTRPAQNAFLKLLEDGPRTTIYILATTDPGKLLGTVKSRCQMFFVRKPNIQKITERLSYICSKEGIKADLATLRMIAVASKGHLRNAITSLEMLTYNGEVSKEDVKRFYNIDLSEDIAKVLIQLPENKKEAFSRMQEILEKITPADFVSIVLDLISKAVLYSSGIDAQEIDKVLLDKLSSMYSISPTRWVDELISVNTAPELFVKINALVSSIVPVNDDGGIVTYSDMKKKAKKRKVSKYDETIDGDRVVPVDEFVKALKPYGLVEIIEKDSVKKEEKLTTKNKQRSIGKEDGIASELNMFA